MVELKLFDARTGFMLYDYIIGGLHVGQFEVGFDEGKFNGVIVYAGFETENVQGEFEWVDIPQNNEVYKIVRDKAIEDYNQHW